MRMNRYFYLKFDMENTMDRENLQIIQKLSGETKSAPIKEYLVNSLIDYEELKSKRISFGLRLRMILFKIFGNIRKKFLKLKRIFSDNI